MTAPAFRRALASAALLAFWFGAGLRETLHAACPMHDGVALAEAIASQAAAEGHHHAPAGHEDHDAGGDGDQEPSHVCDCMGDCAPGSVRALMLPSEVAAVQIVAPTVTVRPRPLRSLPAPAASPDYLLPPATAPPSFV